MRIAGEFLFNSFAEALSYVKSPSNYEKDHDIDIIATRVIHDEETLKLVDRVTSDGRHALIIFFKNSTAFDVWKFWFPDNPQMELMENGLSAIISRIKQLNGEGGA